MSLPVINPLEAVKARRENLHQEAEKEYGDKFAYAHDMFDRLLNMVAKRFPDDSTAALVAVSTFLEQFGSTIERDGESIANSLAGLTPHTNPAQADKVRELQTRIEKLKEDNTRLANTATAASNQIDQVNDLTRQLASANAQIDALTTTKTNLEGDLQKVNGELASLKDAPVKTDTSASRVTELEQQVAALKEKKDAVEKSFTDFKTELIAHIKKGKAATKADWNNFYKKWLPELTENKPATKADEATAPDIAPEPTKPGVIRRTRDAFKGDK